MSFDRDTPMNPPQPLAADWPLAAGAMDESLDLAGVIEATGCSAEDLVELSRIFLQEIDNMIGRLGRAETALAGEPGGPDWPAAMEQLRTAAHELKTSFGIVGARCAEAYANSTQLRLRRGHPMAHTPPSAPELRTAAAALRTAVLRVGELLQRQQP